LPALLGAVAVSDQAKDEETVMYCQMSISGASFERLIKYRIADSFRPLAQTMSFPENKKSWLDGIIVTRIEFNRVENDRFVVVNELSASGLVGPNSAGHGYNALAVAMVLTANLFFALEQDVAEAGLARPAVVTQPILLLVTIRASVGPNGIPVLSMELDPAGLSALALPAAVVPQITAAATASYPFDIGGQLKDIFPPGNSKVLNAGITRDANNAIVLRFEFPGGAQQSTIARSHDWQDNFYSLSFRANLGDDAWCMDLDGSAVASGLAKLVNSAFKGEKPIFFDMTSPSSSFVDTATPRVVVTKPGRVDNACAGTTYGLLRLPISTSLPPKICSAER